MNLKPNHKGFLVRTTFIGGLEGVKSWPKLDELASGIKFHFLPSKQVMVALDVDDISSLTSKQFRSIRTILGVEAGAVSVVWSEVPLPDGNGGYLPCKVVSLSNPGKAWKALKHTTKQKKKERTSTKPKKLVLPLPNS